MYSPSLQDMVTHWDEAGDTAEVKNPGYTDLCLLPCSCSLAHRVQNVSAGLGEMKLPDASSLYCS